MAPDTPASRLERMGDLLQQTTPRASLQQHLEGRAKLIASVERMGRPRRARVAVAGLAFAAAMAAAVLLLVRSRIEPRAIAWHVENATVGAQGYVSIPATAPSARLVFDDGSDVTLAPGSRGRVASTTASGAEVVLEQGRARVHVQHRQDTRWMVDVGPFAVRVTGTEFTVAWAADAETVDVWMRAGHVEVTGPVLADALGLAGGQHLRARLRDATVQIDSAAEPAEGAGAEEPSPSPPLIPSVSPSDLPAVPPVVVPSPSGGSSWSVLVAAGDFGRVVKEAETDGVGRALATRPLADLRALGDAARYGGKSALSRRAYEAVRARFPSSSEARTAAFLLGRVAEEQDHANDEALRWYDRYLAEAPAGGFAGDALGRKMVLVQKSGGRDAALPFARQYLKRFPTGPYAGVARDLAP
jgi:hypothetical protein